MNKEKQELFKAISMTAKLDIMRKNIIWYLCSFHWNFITHFTEAEWGGSISVMEKHGKAFIRMYWFNDDTTTLYLDMLSVDETERKQGIGNKLFKLCEGVGYRLDVSVYSLWVKKDSWMHDWYKRKGYIDTVDKEGEENCVWMDKQAKK